MLYIDCREGLSGDMLLAALLDLVPEPRRKELVGDISHAAERRGLVFSVMEISEQGEAGLGISYSAKEASTDEVSYDDAHSTIRQMCKDLRTASDLPLKILGLIFDAEAEAHGRPASQVHLHEIGRPQALLNIAAIGAAHDELEKAGAGEIIASSITTGKGIVVVSHGAVRVPAPAAKILLRGLAHSSGDDPGERATPSGIAAMRAMISRQSDEVPENPLRKGIGFGTRRFGGRLGRTVICMVADRTPTG
jgi:pyridinium-3,5-bisthiocarboxylic acid mononucleotide nickel chelatase